MNNSEVRQSKTGVRMQGHIGKCLQKKTKAILYLVKSKDDPSKFVLKVIDVHDKEFLHDSFNVDNLINQAR